MSRNTNYCAMREKPIIGSKLYVLTGAERGQTQHPLRSVCAWNHRVLEDCRTGGAGHLQVSTEPIGPHAANLHVGYRCVSTARRGKPKSILDTAHCTAKMKESSRFKMIRVAHSFSCSSLRIPFNCKTDFFAPSECCPTRFIIFLLAWN